MLSKALISYFPQMSDTSRDESSRQAVTTYYESYDPTSKLIAIILTVAATVLLC